MTMNTIYRLKTDSSYDGDGYLHTAYGIAAIDTFGNEIRSFSDVFFDKAKAERLITLCNKEKLSLIHLEDIVEDALTKQYML